jgi:hypothetical protein
MTRSDGGARGCTVTRSLCTNAAVLGSAQSAEKIRATIASSQVLRVLHAAGVACGIIVEHFAHDAELVEQVQRGAAPSVLHHQRRVRLQAARHAPQAVGSDGRLLRSAGGHERVSCPPIRPCGLTL